VVGSLWLVCLATAVLEAGGIPCARGVSLLLRRYGEGFGGVAYPEAASRPLLLGGRLH